MYKNIEKSNINLKSFSWGMEPGITMEEFIAEVIKTYLTVPANSHTHAVKKTTWKYDNHPSSGTIAKWLKKAGVKRRGIAGKKRKPDFEKVRQILRGGDNNE